VFRNPQVGLEVDRLGKLIVIRLLSVALIDYEQIDRLGDRLLGVLDEPGCRWVVLDLGRVEHMASAMIGRVLGLHRRLRGRDGRLVLCNVSADILNVLEVLRLCPFFSIQRNEQEALLALQRLA
jgi:anti-anti-sigma factor